MRDTQPCSADEFRWRQRLEKAWKVTPAAICWDIFGVTDDDYDVKQILDLNEPDMIHFRYRFCLWSFEFG